MRPRQEGTNNVTPETSPPAAQAPWTVLDTQASWRHGPDHTWMIRINWRSPQQVPHRQVRTWSLWRPWQAPRAHEIPDEATGWHEFQADRVTLPPGHYILELVIPPATTAGRPWRPPMRHPSVALLHLGETEEHDAHLATLEHGGLRCVERYLASLLRDGRSNLTTLYPLRESIQEGDIAALLRMRMTMATLSVDERLPISELEEFTGQFLLEDRNLGALCTALADEAHRADSRARQALLEQCVSLDLVLSERSQTWHELVRAEVRHELWELWPPLGAILAPQGTTELSDGLGHEGLARLRAWTPGCFPLMGVVQDPELPVDLRQLKLLEGLLDLPEQVGRILDDDAYAVGCMAWMKRAAADNAESSTHWARTATPSLRAWLDKAAGAALIDRALVVELDRRWPPPLHSEHSRVPWCVGAVALLCRARSRTRERRVRLHLNERDLRPHLMAAHRLAPELLAHDLCLAEVLLRRTAANPQHTRSAR